MKIFNEKKNKYFSICRKIINRSLEETITVNDFDEYLKKEGFIEYNFDFKRALFGKSSAVFESIHLFEEKDSKINPVIKKKVPVLLTDLEKEWLKNTISDNNANSFFSESTLAKLCATLDLKFYTTKDASMPLRAILDAIRENKWIVCDNHTPSGKVYENTVIAPYRIEFSKYLNTFWLIGFIVKEEKLVKIQLERMQIKDIIKPSRKIDFAAIIKRYIKDEPIILELREEKGVLERALHMFSSYKKEGYYDKKENLYQLKITYYSFDEEELIKNIMSLGPFIKVIKPQRIAEKIKETINMQKDIFGETSHTFFDDI